MAGAGYPCQAPGKALGGALWVGFRQAIAGLWVLTAGMARMINLLVKNKVMIYLVVILGILGMGYWIHSAGYSSGVENTKREYQARMDEERLRVRAANEIAQQAAIRRQAVLQQLMNERDVTIFNLGEEAKSDLDSNSRAISADSVRRINRIR